MTRALSKPAPAAPMPPKVAAYLDIARMRERVFMVMFERYGEEGRALEATHRVCLFIEEGELDHIKSTRTSQPGALPVDEASAPGNAGKAPADSGAESERVDQELSPAAEVQSQPAQAGAEGQSGSSAEALVAVKNRTFRPDQVEAFRKLWLSGESTRACAEALNVPFGSAYYYAEALGLPTKRGKTNLGRPATKPTPRALPTIPKGAIVVTLDGAIDWYESQDEGRPVVPSQKYQGSFELGDSQDAPVITRNALVAEINALRRRKGEEPFTITTNGVEQHAY